MGLAVSDVFDWWGIHRWREIGCIYFLWACLTKGGRAFCCSSDARCLENQVTRTSWIFIVFIRCCELGCLVVNRLTERALYPKCGRSRRCSIFGGQP